MYVGTYYSPTYGSSDISVAERCGQERCGQERCGQERCGQQCSHFVFLSAELSKGVLTVTLRGSPPDVKSPYASKGVYVCSVVCMCQCVYVCSVVCMCVCVHGVCCVMCMCVHVCMTGSWSVARRHTTVVQCSYRASEIPLSAPCGERGVVCHLSIPGTQPSR